MGGRGSCYLNFGNSSEEFFSEILDNTKEDEDTEKYHEGYTDKLKEKQIHIKKSTDSIKEEILIPNMKKVDDLSKKYASRIGFLQDTKEELRIRKDKLTLSSDMCFIYNTDNYSQLQIVYNDAYSLTDRKTKEHSTQKMVESKWWSQCDKNEYINKPITHEYGHYIQKCLLEKYKLKHQEEWEEIMSKCETIKETRKATIDFNHKFEEKCMKEIQRIHRKEFGKEDITMISRYGQDSNAEAFAELFSELNSSSTPNTMAQALNIFLEKEINDA